MRRNYISPEFTYVGQYGTMNMIEETSFFGSKMLSIENEISILNQNIIYYQNANNEQLNFSTEKNSTPIIYSAISDKNNNQSIIIDPSQSSIQKNSNTQWILTINIQNILINYIFANLKQNRTFNGISNNMTIYNNINTSMTNYITQNILNRYQYNSIDLFIQYNSFGQNGSLRYNNSFIEITDIKYLITQLQPTLDQSGDILTLKFNQTQNSSLFNFNYYYNLYFDRIT